MMLIFANILLLLFFERSFALTEAGNPSGVQACDAQQFGQMPCRCCKMDCWYSIANSATHQLGHIPGQAGEEEALATLRLIRACMISECSSFCSTPLGMKKRRFPAVIAPPPQLEVK